MRAMLSPMVLLHGWGFQPGIWSPVVEAMRQRGVASEILTPALPLSENMSQASALESLFVSLPKKTHLVGWSLGGELALAFASCFPERVDTLTLISSTPCFMNRSDWTSGQPTSLLDDFDQRLQENPAALLKRFATLIRHGDSTATRDKALSAHLLAVTETDPDRLATGLTFLRTLDLRNLCAMDEERPSITLIHGTADHVVPLEASLWLEAQFDTPLMRIEGGSHALPLTHAGQIADTLATLL